MEIARQAKSIINWNGKNITDEISRFLSSVTYIDREEESCDEVTIVLDDSEHLWAGDWYPAQGDYLELFIGYIDKLVNCGLFQIDELDYSGPPDQMTIKAIAAGITKQLRSRNSKAFEAQTLRQIAQYFCIKHGLTLVDSSSMLSQINLDRKTQEEKTDLAFLSELAAEYGFLFSIRGNKMVFISYYDLDNAASIKTIDKSKLSSYSFKEKTYDTYASGKIASHNLGTSKVVDWSEDYEGSSYATEVLLLNGKVTNKQQAEAKVKGGLWKKNKFKQTGSLTDLPGDPEMLSGINFDLTGALSFSGKYHITEATHSITGDSAYTTSVEIRKTGTIPKPQRVPKPKTEEIEQFDENVNDYEEG